MLNQSFCYVELCGLKKEKEKIELQLPVKQMQGKKLWQVILHSRLRIFNAVCLTRSPRIHFTSCYSSGFYFLVLTIQLARLADAHLI